MQQRNGDNPHKKVNNMKHISLGQSLKSKINITVYCSTGITGELADYVNEALSSISQLTDIQEITLNDAVLQTSALEGYHLPNVALLLMLAHKEIFKDSKISVRAKYYNQHKNLRYTKGGYDIFPYIDSMKNLVKQWVKNNPSEVEALKNVLCEINIGATSLFWKLSQ